MKRYWLGSSTGTVQADIRSPRIADSFLHATQVAHTRRAHQVTCTVVALNTLKHGAYDHIPHGIFRGQEGSTRIPTMVQTQRKYLPSILVLDYCYETRVLYAHLPTLSMKASFTIIYVTRPGRTGLIYTKYTCSFYFTHL